MASEACAGLVDSATIIFSMAVDSRFSSLRAEWSAYRGGSFSLEEGWHLSQDERREICTFSHDSLFQKESGCSAAHFFFWTSSHIGLQLPSPDLTPEALLLSS